MTLNEFVKKYKNGVDYDGCYGKQCVDYVNAYAKDVLGIKDAFYGQGIRYAYQVYADFESLPRVKANFTRIANSVSTLNYPQAGDIIVWSKQRNGYAGHIAVVLGATEHTIKVAEQNYDGNGSVRVHTYRNYNCVLGWLRAKNARFNRPTVKPGDVIKLNHRAKLYNFDSAQSGVKTVADFSPFDCLQSAVFAEGAKIEVKDTKQKANGDIWVKTKYGDGWICIYDYKTDKSKV